MIGLALLRAHLWLFAFLVPLLVRLLPLGRLLPLVTPFGGWHPYRANTPEQILELVRRRLAKPRMMKRRACLREGLTLYHFLRLAGHPAVIQIGVYPREPEDERGHAHCWILLHGRMLSNPPSKESAVVLTYPPESQDRGHPWPPGS